MATALARADWHQDYALPVLESAAPSTLSAQWKCDRDGIPRCHWALVLTRNFIAARSRMDPAYLELVR